MDWAISLALVVVAAVVLLGWLGLNWLGGHLIEPVIGAAGVAASRVIDRVRRRNPWRRNRPSGIPAPPS
jgi:Na+-transporting methylmalonyl-CoA/oxaloacetate decarboxylase beta subunit